MSEKHLPEPSDVLVWLTMISAAADFISGYNSLLENTQDPDYMKNVKTGLANYFNRHFGVEDFSGTVKSVEDLFMLVLEQDKTLGLYRRSSLTNKAAFHLTYEMAFQEYLEQLEFKELPDFPTTFSSNYFYGYWNQIMEINRSIVELFVEDLRQGKPKMGNILSAISQFKLNIATG